MDINLTLFAQAIEFALFIWIAKKFAWPLMMEKVEERNKKIADGLAAAEKGAKSLELASVKSDEALKAARVQAQEILANASKQAALTVEQAKGAAQTEAERIKASARDEVASEVNKARETLRKQVGELAVTGAAKILKREINAATHADVLKELAAKI